MDLTRIHAPRWAVVGFVAAAYLITWIVLLPLVASAARWTDWSTHPWWHASGAIGPFIAAVWFAARTNTLDRLWAGWRRANVGKWYYVAAVSPLLLTLPAALLTRLTSGQWPSMSGWQSLTFTALILGALLPAVAYGVGEETGWRGYLLPRLQSRLNPWLATLTLSAVWIGWHTPFYFYRDGMAGTAPAEKLVQFVVMAIGALFLTWLFNSTGGSILLVAIWHTSHSIVHILTPATSMEWETWNGALTTLTALTVILLFRKGLTTRPHHAQQDPPLPGAVRQAVSGVST